MDTKTEKEGQGVKGSGFEGRTGSNSYSALPKSSNAGLGIDPNVARGVGNAVSNTNTGGAQNVGSKEGKSSNKSMGYDEPWATGTVGATENMGGYGPRPDDRGQFGVAVGSGGHKEGSTSDTLGSGARAKGTASDSGGRPGQTGSMAMAFSGLSGKGGSNVSTNTSAPLTIDRAKAKAGQQTKTNVGNN